MSLNFVITKGSDDFGPDEVTSLSYYIERSPISETLSADVLRFEVEAPETDFSGYKYGDEVLFTENGAVRGKYYFRSLKQVTPTRYALECISAVGLMQTAVHKGGVYQGVAVEALIADILQATAVSTSGSTHTYSGLIDYSIDADVGGVLLYGYLAYQKVSEALQQVLFATGAGLMKDVSGDVYIKYPIASTVVLKNDDYVYAGGSFEELSPATEIVIAEHSFYAYAGDISKVLFDNTDGSGAVLHKEVVFDAPMHDLDVTGSLFIESQGVNFAVISGVGILTGLEYTHTKRYVRHETGAAGAENVISVNNATLVSTANSDNVALRVASCYGALKQLSREIVLDNEYPGDFMRIASPLGGDATGIIKSLSVTVSGIDKAAMVLLPDFVPGNFGNNFSSYELITDDGTFEVPEGVTKIRVVIVGGGAGGSGGYAGKACSNKTDSSQGDDWADGGDGGEPGVPGIGGNVYTIDLDNLAPGDTFSVSIGAGGVAGAAESPGSPGGDTTFGPYSSANGAPSSTGVINFLTGDLYAVPGPNGYKGSKGGSYPGGAGESFFMPDGTEKRGGSGAAQDAYFFFNQAGSPTTEGNSSYIYTLTRASGGGAAYGANGKNAYTSLRESLDGPYPSVHSWQARGEGGGDGATAQPLDFTPGLAQGGAAGNGGGGGGKMAGVSIYIVPARPPQGTPTGIVGTQGPGGAGSAGGPGGPGFVIVYY